MTHRGWLLGVLALLVSASFAGCLGGDEDEPTTDETAAQTDDSDGNVTGNETVNDDTNVDTGADANTTTAAPEAAFVVEGNATVAPGETLTVNAADTVDTDTAAENLTFSWDFGDGNTAEGLNATHAFAEVGNYTITLNVTDPEGNSDEANMTIVVESGFEEAVVGVFEGTILVPNPVVHNGAAAHSQVDACGTSLECYTTLGGAEGTSFALHTVDIPAGAEAVSFATTGDGGTLSFAVFDASGARVVASGVNIVSTNDADVVATKADQPALFGSTLTVFVNSPWLPNQSYVVTVTALAEDPTAEA